MSISKNQSVTNARSKLVARRGKLARLRVHNESDGADLRQGDGLRERSSAEEIADVLVSLAERERREVAAIDAAIGRIDVGTWGRCPQCGGKIGLRRLAAMPEAHSCLECAAANPDRS